MYLAVCNVVLYALRGGICDGKDKKGYFGGFNRFYYADAFNFNKS